MTASSRVETFRAWPGWARATAYVATGLVLLLVLLLVAGVLLVRRPLPQTDGEVTVPGLGADVEVLRDERGVPQVYADDAADLFYAQGFVQAQDRFYEMDVRRHATAGRLAELLGEAAVESDLVVRTMGWRRVAEQEVDLLSPSTRSYLEAYSAGVNAWLEDRDLTQLGVEYSLLAFGGPGYQPQPWTPADSVAWLKAMAWDLRGNVQDEVDRARLNVSLTPNRVEELYPRYPYDRNAPALPEEGRRALGRAATALDAAPALLGRGEGIGSNGWAVSGEHTATGEALLAGDPHLEASLPGVWYQMGLHCRVVDEQCPFDVAGFTFAGMPGVVIGHNQDLAWTMTNLDPDVTDLFLEDVEGATYRYGRRQLPLVEREETVRVADGQDRQLTVRSTRHGPLLSDVAPELSSLGVNARGASDTGSGDGYAVALAWTALTPRPTADAIFALNRATGWEEFREAASQLAVPGQNLVYADRDGNIGYQATGEVPIRRGGRNGRYPAQGWDPAQDWTGRTIPFEQLPSRLNPEEGFVVSANQAATEPGYPFLLSADVDLGYRSQRIRDLLEGRLEGGGRVGVADLAAIQADSRSPAAQVLVPALLRVLMASEYYADGQRLLVDWDGQQRASSAAAAYFNTVWRLVLERTFHDELPEAQWPDGGARWVAVVENLLQQPQSTWWDDTTTEGVIENRDDVLATAMRDARDDLTRTLSVSPRQWSWGRLHELELESTTLGRSDSSVARLLLNRGPFEVGGGSTSVDATGWEAPEGYGVTTVPSMRMLVDLGDLDRSRWVNLTGASGHPASPHYRDQVEAWVAGRTYPWAWSEQVVRGAAQQRLVLRPEDD